MEGSIPNMNPKGLALLREVSNIGAGNAAASLSTFLGKTVTMEISRVVPMPFAEIIDSVGAERVVATIFARFSGGISGNILFVMGLEEARALIRHMTGVEEGEGFSEMGFSALQEVGNIVIGSYLTALSDFLGLELNPTVPSLAVDMAGAVLGFSLSEIGRSEDHALMFDGCIASAETRICEGSMEHIFLLPDPDSFERIFLSLGVPSDGRRH